MEYNGHEYHLNMEAILQAEAENPEYSFFSELENFGRNLRMTDLVRMCKYVGSTYQEMFTERRLRFEDLPKIVGGCLEEVGFYSGEPAQA